MSDKNQPLPESNIETAPKLMTEFDNNCFINREISHLLFNSRVLEQSLDSRHPLLERLKFLLIFCSNMDEFFEVRVAKLKLQMRFGREIFGPDGLSPKNTLRRLSEMSHSLVQKQYQILNETLLPLLAEENIYFRKREDWTDEQRKWIKQYFDTEIAPIVSPIALDPAHPFPKLVNKSLNFIVTLKGKDAFGRESRLAIVPAPRTLPRLIKLPAGEDSIQDEFIFLSAIIHEFIDSFFHGMTATGCYQFRVTRNSDLHMNEDEMEDIAAEVKGKLFSRRYGNAVRLEVVDDCPQNIKEFLLDQFELTDKDLFETNGPVNLQRMFAVFGMVERPELEYPEFSPKIPKSLETKKNLFDSIKSKDHLMLHPYNSFVPVLDFLRQAANDPQVMSMKQTLYRVGHDSEIANILVEAALRGKEVTVVIELRARFDEQDNLALASRLQEAGAVVCYGVVGYKTHAKMAMVLRKEDGKFCHYVHLGTGNYHAGNARLYTDYSLFTSNKDICDDVHNIFLQLTGMGKTLPMKYLINAPFTFKKKIIQMIDNEIEAQKGGGEGRIVLKVNALTEKDVISKLYIASQHGVKIDLIVRGPCALKPGVEGISDNIKVKSIIGRFLEHTRVFYFANSSDKIYCSSADLMDRNLKHRVEVCFPILSEKIRQSVINDLKLFIEDEGQSWVLDQHGDYRLITDKPNQKLVQQILLDKHCETAAAE